MRRIESVICITLLLLATWFSIQSLSLGTKSQVHAVVAKSNASHGVYKIAFQSLNSPLVSASWAASNTTIDVNQYQTLSATVDGGTPPYTYTFLVYDPLGNLVANALDTTDPSPTSKFVFTQNSTWGTGIFTANLIVTDSSDSIETVSNTLTYYVQSASTTSTSTSTTTTIQTLNTTFSENGLPSNGENWSVTFNGSTENAIVPNSITFNAIFGTYPFSINAVLLNTTYFPTPQYGNLLAGNSIMIGFNSTTTTSTTLSTTTATTSSTTTSTIISTTSTTSSTSSTTSSTSSSTTISTSTTTVPTYTVFHELGLPAGTQWNVTFNGSTENAIAPYNISFNAVPGTSYLYITRNVTSSSIVYTPNPLPDVAWETWSNSVLVVYSSAESNSTTSISTTSSTSTSTSTSIASSSSVSTSVQTTVEQSSSGDDNSGANAPSGGSGRLIRVFSYSDPAINLSCLEIVNFSERDSVNISVRGQAFTMVDNFITPNSTGVTINGWSITLLNGTAASLAGAYSVELVNVSYLPILHTTKIVICGRGQIDSPQASPIEMPDPATPTTLETTMPATTASGSTSVTTVPSGVVVLSGISLNVQAIAATGIAIVIGAAIGLASNRPDGKKKGQGRP